MLPQFLSHPQQTGAVAPSSRTLARKLADLTFAPNPRIVVEIGAGSGAVTRELVARAKRTGARVVAVELDAGLAFRAGRGVTAQADAARLPIRRADVVVSGIPFGSLRPEQSEAILAEAARVAPRIVLFQYTKMRAAMIERHFPDVRGWHRVLRNIPPAHAIEACTPAAPAAAAAPA